MDGRIQSYLDGTPPSATTELGKYKCSCTGAVLSTPVDTPDTRFQKALAEALGRARAERCLRQRDVAARCGLSAQTITNMKTGAHTPTLHSVRGLVDGLAEFGFDAWSALGIESPAGQASGIATTPPPGQHASRADEVLTDLVDAADALRSEGGDLVEAWRRAEQHIHEMRRP